MMSNLRDLIPGPISGRASCATAPERFEARFSLVEVQDSPSAFFAGMAGSVMPIAVSHGEGRVEVRDAAHLAALQQSGLVGLRFVDNRGNVTVQYPANPNGSPDGITAVTSADGRATIMMPHPGGCSAPWPTPSTRTTGERMAPGCACSAMLGFAWVKRQQETKPAPVAGFMGMGLRMGRAGGGEHDGGKAIFSSLLGELLAGGYGMD